jgi:hypothetical protein
MNARSLLAIGVVAAALVAAAPSTAQAAPPLRFPGDPTPTPVAFGPGGVVDPCGFAIDAVVTNREAITFFSSGSILVAGTYKVSMVNPANGKVLSINASGPGRIDPNGNFSGTGLQVFFLGPDEALGGGIYLIRGNTDFSRDENGLVDSITTRGTQSENLCALLA